MQIRPYRAAEIADIAELFTASVHTLTRQHYNAAQRAAWAPQPPDLDQWQLRLAPLETFVADIDSRLAGFLSYHTRGHIEFLYVSPDHARGGVAAALLREAEEALILHGVQELTTEASLVARPFFERHGFIVIEEQTVERRGVIFHRFAMTKRSSVPPVPVTRPSRPC